MHFLQGLDLASAIKTTDLADEDSFVVSKRTNQEKISLLGFMTGNGNAEELVVQRSDVLSRLDVTKEWVLHVWSELDSFSSLEGILRRCSSVDLDVVDDLAGHADVHQEDRLFISVLKQKDGVSFFSTEVLLLLEGREASPLLVLHHLLLCLVSLALNPEDGALDLLVWLEELGTRTVEVAQISDIEQRLDKRQLESRDGVSDLSLCGLLLFGVGGSCDGVELVDRQVEGVVEKRLWSFQLLSLLFF